MAAHLYLEFRKEHMMRFDFELSKSNRESHNATSQIKKERNTTLNLNVDYSSYKWVTEKHNWFSFGRDVCRKIGVTGNSAQLNYRTSHHANTQGKETRLLPGELLNLRSKNRSLLQIAYKNTEAPSTHISVLK